MMGKGLSEMILAELWQLFPIMLVPQSQELQEWYECESHNLVTLIPKDSLSNIHHIGSTAIKKIQAKNIVDILVELTDEAEISQIGELLSSHGYRVMSSEEGQLSLNKGYTKNGFSERVFHCHLRFKGDKDEVFFKDYLNSHLDIAKEYEGLKLNLAKDYKHNRDGYTDAKSEFINKWTKVAKKGCHKSD